MSTTGDEEERQSNEALHSSDSEVGLDYLTRVLESVSAKQKMKSSNNIFPWRNELTYMHDVLTCRA